MKGKTGRKPQNPTQPRGAISFLVTDRSPGTGHKAGHETKVITPSPSKLMPAPSPEELEPENGDQTSAMVPAHNPDGRFATGNKAAKGKGRSKLGAALGLHPSIFSDSKDPSYRRCMAKAAGYRRDRTRELFNTHGYVSGGVSSLVANAALALSASRYLLELAGETQDMETRVKLMAESQKMQRQQQAHELAAWELCSREGAAHRANKKEVLPWLQQIKEEPNE